MMNVNDGCFDNDDAAKAYVPGREDEMSRKDCAFHTLSAAEKAWWAYFCECEVGPERVRAHEIYERIRRATHI